MNENIELHRLTKAIADLAGILVETTAARVREQHAVVAPPVVQYPPKALDPLMTKREVAAYLNVSLRTVDNMLRKNRLPHIRLSSRCLRFMLSDVEEELKRRFRIAR